MLGSSLCESRKATLGPRTGARASMELTAAHRESSGTLAGRAPARSGLAPLTLPVWAVKPWFGVGFHSAQLSSVYGVLLYPILGGVARYAWLGMPGSDRGPSKTILRKLNQGNADSRSKVRALWSDRVLVPC